MALIKCKECGKEISEQAGNCPNCGWKNDYTEIEIKKNREQKKAETVMGIILAIMGIIIGIILLFDSLNKAMNGNTSKNTNKKSYDYYIEITPY